VNAVAALTAAQASTTSFIIIIHWLMLGLSCGRLAHLFIGVCVRLGAENRKQGRGKDNFRRRKLMACGVALLERVSVFLLAAVRTVDRQKSKASVRGQKQHKRKALKEGGRGPAGANHHH